MLTATSLPWQENHSRLTENGSHFGALLCINGMKYIIFELIILVLWASYSIFVSNIFYFNLSSDAVNLIITFKLYDSNIAMHWLNILTWEIVMNVVVLCNICICISILYVYFVLYSGTEKKYKILQWKYVWNEFTDLYRWHASNKFLLAFLVCTLNSTSSPGTTSPISPWNSL